MEKGKVEISISFDEFRALLDEINDERQVADNLRMIIDKLFESIIGYVEYDEVSERIDTKAWFDEFILRFLKENFNARYNVLKCRLELKAGHNKVGNEEE